MNDLTVIIVSYYGLSSLELCIRSVLNKINPHQVIIVDNSSLIDIRVMVEKYNNLIYIDPGVNIGFGAGCNLGSRYAETRLLFFLNPDCIIENWNSQLIYSIIEDNRLVGFNIINDDNIPVMFGGKLPSITTEFFSLLPERIYTSKIMRFCSSVWINNELEYLPIESLIGASILTKKSLFDNLNGFDENFFLYYEDNDLCFRALNNGYSSIISNAALIRHSWGGSLKSGATNKVTVDSYMYISRNYFFRKYYPLYWRLIFIIDLLKIVRKYAKELVCYCYKKIL